MLHLAPSRYARARKLRRIHLVAFWQGYEAAQRWCKVTSQPCGHGSMERFVIAGPKGSGVHQLTGFTRVGVDVGRDLMHLRRVQNPTSFGQFGVGDQPATWRRGGSADATTAGGLAMRISF